MNKKVLFVSLLAMLWLPLMPVPSSGWVYPDCTEDIKYETFGPRLDGLLMSLYANDEAEFEALANNEIDITDWPISEPYYDMFDTPPLNETIKMVNYGPDLDEIVLEINNNDTLPDGSPNPCRVLSFRRALAHLVDRLTIIDLIDLGFGFPMYTEVWPGSPMWVHPEILPGGVLEHLTYPYDPTMAALLLDWDGFPIGTDGWRYWDRNNNTIKDPGEDLLLRFYIRADDTKKLEIGQYIAAEIQAVDIHVEMIFVGNMEAWLNVMTEKNFHLYTGDRNLKKYPSYLYDLKHSQMYWHPGWCPNYINFNNETYDNWAMNFKTATNISDAINAAFECQETFAEQVGSIPIECRLGVKAMSRRYTGTPGILDEEDMYEGQYWKGIVNGYWDKCSCGAAWGINSWWTFLNAYPEGHIMGDCQHMTMRYGLKTPELKLLNSLYSFEYWDWEVLNKIYDTLFKEDPYNPSEIIPWMVKNWTEGTWWDPEDGFEKSKITITLRSDICWHDGIPVSIEDIKYTLFDLPKDLEEAGCPPPWFHAKVKLIKDACIIDPCNIEILFDVLSIWAIHWVGDVKILPKHIWKPIVDSIEDGTHDPWDLTGFSPDYYLVGCGPYRLVEYVPFSHVLLTTNKPSSIIDIPPTDDFTFSDVHPHTPGTPVHSDCGYFRWKPINIDIHIIDPPEYIYKQKVPPNTSATFQIDLHNQWLNPIPNTADSTNTGLLHVSKHIWIRYPNGTEAPLVIDEPVDLPACEHHYENVIKEFDPCHHQLKVALLVTGPDPVVVTKEGGLIQVPNPWLGRWINYTFDFWVTIPEDIGGAWFDSWHDPPQLPAPDCRVDIIDIGMAAKAFGSAPGHERWCCLADVYKDYKIDIRDIVRIAYVYRWNWAPERRVPNSETILAADTWGKTVVCRTMNLTVYMELANVTNLWAYDIIVDYNTTLLELVEGQVISPFTGSVLEIPGYIAITSLQYPPFSSNESVRIAKLIFTAKTKGEATIDPGTSDLASGCQVQRILYNPITADVNITMLGDITGPDGWPDGRCEMRDVGLVARAAFSNRVTDQTSPKYGEYWHPTPCDMCPHNPNCDVFYDDKIDMRDVGIVARHCFETDP